MGGGAVCWWWRGSSVCGFVFGISMRNQLVIITASLRHTMFTFLVVISSLVLGRLGDL